MGVVNAGCAWTPAIGAILLGARMAAADTVSGQFEVKGRVIVPQHAAAYAVRDPRNPRQWATEVVLSEGAVDVDAAVAALSPHADVINQDGVRAGNYVLLWVRPDGEVSMNATFSATMTQYVDSTRGGWMGGRLRAELTSNTAELVAGRVRTLEPVKTMNGETYQVDVSFSTAIGRPPAGNKLGARGGEPGKALEALWAAMRRKDWPAIRRRMSPSSLASLEADYRTAEENRAYVLDLLAAWLPKKKMKVTGGEIRGETAILEVEGEAFAGRMALYQVRMVRETGGWGFDGAALVGLL